MEGIKHECKIELYTITDSLAWNICNNERGESPFSLCTWALPSDLDQPSP